MKTIDLNADVGEGAPHDAELIPLVTSANIACGGHAGDAATMEAAARVAIEHGVAIGAHPGHVDREHFGRRELPITPAELFDLLNRQVNRLHAVVRGLGGEIHYLKLHGALYHQTGRDTALAEAVIRFVHEFHIPLAVLGQGASTLNAAAEQGGIPFYAEAFADRAYRADGSLAPRSELGAMLCEPNAVASQAIRLADAADSLCLHGDEAGVIATAHGVRNALERERYLLRPFAS